MGRSLGSFLTLCRCERLEKWSYAFQHCIQRAAAVLGNDARRRSARGAERRIVKKTRHRGRQTRSAHDFLGRAAIGQGLCHRRTIRHVRAVQDGAAEASRLERVVPPFGHERPANKSDVGQAVKQTELAQRVG